eukprot:TRINITY_DN4955_c0_g1_i2.p1 TRINITY_DN4955_c0_g1~~TRINITY_DN4955_c0_g1_i2.p1  ORF type:complete len:311 (-),score=39.04 TRINITY_DN4955_c0_g1_i2:35-967(-)
MVIFLNCYQFTDKVYWSIDKNLANYPLSKMVHGFYNVLPKLEKVDAIFYNIFICSLVRNKEIDSAAYLLMEMKTKQVEYNAQTYSLLFDVLKRLPPKQEIEMFEKFNIERPDFIEKNLFFIFDELVSTNIVVDYTLFDKIVQYDEDIDEFNLLFRLENRGVNMNVSIYNKVAENLVTENQFDLFLNLMNRIYTNKIDIDPLLYIKLISYLSVNRPTEVFNWFKMMIDNGIRPGPKIGENIANISDDQDVILDCIEYMLEKEIDIPPKFWKNAFMQANVNMKIQIVNKLALAEYEIPQRFYNMIDELKSVN